MTVWLDGRLMDSADARVSAFDHGFTVGDGVFETCKVTRGRPFALSRHLARLARSAASMGLPRPDEPEVRRAVAAVMAEARDLPVARLRITYTGGPAPLGSARGGGAEHTPTLFVAVAPTSTCSTSAALASVPWPRNEHAASAGVKSTSYAENVIALAHARRRGADEAAFANTAGRLCEGTGSNIFVVLDGRVLTPPLRSGALDGVTRALVLQWCPDVVERDLPFGVLGEAEEIFLTSSTRDVQAVHLVDGRQLDPAPGPRTRAIAETFTRRAAQCVDPP